MVFSIILITRISKALRFLLHPNTPINIQLQAMKREITVINKQGQKLEGVLHDTGSTHIVVLCHAFRSTKEHFAMVKLAEALESEGISAFRFDFSLTEYTEDSYYSGNYNSELEDLRAVVEYFSGINRFPAIVLGHSKGANVVLEYASKYHDIGGVINVSGRYDPRHIDLKSKRASPNNEVRDIPEAWLTIDPKCKVLTVHGTADVDVALEEAYEIGKCISDHQLQIVDGADHTYFSRLDELAAAVVTFANQCVQLWKGKELVEQCLATAEKEKEKAVETGFAKIGFLGIGVGGIELGIEGHADSDRVKV